MDDHHCRGHGAGRDLRERAKGATQKDRKGNHHTDLDRDTGARVTRKLIRPSRLQAANAAFASNNQ
jgi:hypothetical protein